MDFLPPPYDLTRVLFALLRITIEPLILNPTKVYLQSTWEHRVSLLANTPHRLLPICRTVGCSFFFVVFPIVQPVEQAADEVGKLIWHFLQTASNEGLKKQFGFTLFCYQEQRSILTFARSDFPGHAEEVKLPAVFAYENRGNVDVCHLDGRKTKGCSI